MPEFKTLLKRMDMLDLIISLEILTFPAALPVFSLIDALRISSREIVSLF